MDTNDEKQKIALFIKIMPFFPGIIVVFEGSDFLKSFPVHMPTHPKVLEPERPPKLGQVEYDHLKSISLVRAEYHMSYSTLNIAWVPPRLPALHRASRESPEHL